MSVSKKQTENIEYVDNLNIDVLDPVKEIPKDAAITIVGKRRSGKSHLIKYLCYLLRNRYKSVYLFSSTIGTNRLFYDFIPPENIFVGLQEDKVYEIFEEQIKIIQQEEQRGKEKSEMPHVLLIFDDCITSSSGLRKSDALANIYANGRHYCCCCLVAVQSFKSVSPTIRENADVSIAYKFKNGETAEDFVKENFLVNNLDLGIRIMSKICADDKNKYQCIVVLSHLNTNDLHKQLRRFTSKTEVPKFIIDDQFKETKNFNVMKQEIYKTKHSKKSQYQFMGEQGLCDF